jgi:hypothetical protein
MVEWVIVRDTKKEEEEMTFLSSIANVENEHSVILILSVVQK